MRLLGRSFVSHIGLLMFLETEKSTSKSSISKNFFKKGRGSVVENVLCPSDMSVLYPKKI